MTKNENPIYYYCVYCRSSFEHKVIEALQREYCEAKVTALYQDKWKIINGHRTIKKQNMLPGYVFILSEEELEHFRLNKINNVVRVLGRSEEGYLLKGSDIEFARWVFRNNGLIETSKGYSVDNKVVITEGPLKDLEGSIEHIDKRKQIMLVKLGFDGNDINAWLPFDWVEEAGQ